MKHREIHKHLAQEVNFDMNIAREKRFKGGACYMDGIGWADTNLTS